MKAMILKFLKKLNQVLAPINIDNNTINPFSRLTDLEIYHEIGHSLIDYIFHDTFKVFEGITRNPKSVNVNAHEDYRAYKIAKNTSNT